MLRAPSSTSNPLTFLETGTLPIMYEIHVKQLGFLHHILTLEDDDPVKTTYREQLQYPFEPNWGNGVLLLKEKYDISETDEEICQLSKERWKRTVKEKIRSCAHKELVKSASLQKCCQAIELPPDLQRQKYLTELPSANARKIFHIRTGTVDLKGHRKYIYGNDSTCRLCEGNWENVDHVVNECPSIPRGESPLNISTTDCEELMEISRRCLLFDTKVEELKKQECNDFE